MSLTTTKEGLFVRVAPVLRHYDRYPLLCNDGEFSLQVVRFLTQSNFSWAPASSLEKPSLIRLKARLPQQVEEMCRLLDTSKGNHLERHPFPFLFDQAVAQDAKFEGCPLREGIKDAGAREVHKWRELGTYLKFEFCRDFYCAVSMDKTLDLWMAGEVRLQLLSALFKDYLPRNGLRSVDQLPTLLQVFLLHLHQQNPRELLSCWPKHEVSQHVVSGIWIGLPNRPL